MLLQDSRDGYDLLGVGWRAKPLVPQGVSLRAFSSNCSTTPAEPIVQRNSFV